MVYYPYLPARGSQGIYINIPMPNTNIAPQVEFSGGYFDQRNLRYSLYQYTLLYINDNIVTPYNNANPNNKVLPLTVLGSS